jgi:hypothetical protein
MRVEILAYAPTEFYHCQHCEIVWDSVDFGRRIRKEQRIADWVADAHARYGDQLQVKVVDVASIEGVIGSLRHRTRRFPTFVIDGAVRIIGFDPQRLDAALAQRLVDKGA